MTYVLLRISALKVITFRCIQRLVNHLDHSQIVLYVLVRYRQITWNLQEAELRVTIGSHHNALFQALHGPVIELAINKH